MSNFLQPQQLQSMNGFLTSGDNTTDVSTAPTSIFSTILTQTKDISSIPPAFFVGGSEKTPSLDEPMKDARDQRNSSIGYGDRRLSGILAEKPDDTIANPSTKQGGLSKKRIFLGTADAQRGLFGNGDVRKERRGSSSFKQDISSSSQTSESQSKVIRVFGYPSNLVNSVISHFSKYGKIEKYQKKPGCNWLSITYDKNASALAALKSNGVVISKNHLIGVILEEVPTRPTPHNVVPLNDSDGVFKTVDTNTTFNSGLGKGKVGVSAMDTSESIDSGVLSKLKDFFLGW